MDQIYFYAFLMSFNEMGCLLLKWIDFFKSRNNEQYD